MKKLSATSSSSGMTSIEERVHLKIEAIKKGYRVKFVLLTVVFLSGWMVSQMESKPATVEDEVIWFELHPEHQKVIIPVESYVDTRQATFPFQVDLFDGGSKALVKKAWLHGLEKNDQSFEGGLKARLEIPKKQMIKLPKNSLISFKLYPHLGEEPKKAKGVQHEIIF